MSLRFTNYCQLNISSVENESIIQAHIAVHTFTPVTVTVISGGGGRSRTFLTVFAGQSFRAVTLLPRPVVRTRAAVLAGAARASTFQPGAPETLSLIHI